MKNPGQSHMAYSFWTPSTSMTYCVNLNSSIIEIN
ncbi:hypothetical protein E1A91_D12G024500v1 [Gossypium mustelinum]|uniref:Uncharacterized protein n=1 Tax=Gossypium mustelinum TaxID=34275 RepID=A0A5D2S9S8_GOSMU|nr:hypothetical protein E1A91_D12G024500v1 [Gossypium mustelinum]